MASPENKRNLQDEHLIVWGTLPAAGKTTNSQVLDLGRNAAYPVTENFNVRLAITSASGANNKNVTVYLQDSADNATWSNLATGVLQSTDANNAGHSASSGVVQFPPGVKRYVRAQAATEADGGDPSDGSYSVALVF